MPSGPKRIGMTPEEIKDVCHKLEAAHQALNRISAAYPIKFDPAEPYGAANEASQAIIAVGKALTGDPELFSTQRLDPTPPFHKRDD